MAVHGCLLTGVLRMGRLDDKSRMSREAHVRLCEGLRGKLPRSTRPLIHTPLGFAEARDVVSCERKQEKAPTDRGAPADREGKA